MKYAIILFLTISTTLSTVAQRLDENFINIIFFGNEAEPMNIYRPTRIVITNIKGDYIIMASQPKDSLNENGEKVRDEQHRLIQPSYKIRWNKKVTVVNDSTIKWQDYNKIDTNGNPVKTEYTTHFKRNPYNIGLEIIDRQESNKKSRWSFQSTIGYPHFPPQGTIEIVGRVEKIEGPFGNVECFYDEITVNQGEKKVVIYMAEYTWEDDGIDITNKFCKFICEPSSVIECPEKGSPARPNVIEYVVKK